MKVLIACEESQVVCKAFREKGHEAYSCDLQECSGGKPEWHIQDDIKNHLDKNIFGAHPDCTYLTNSGVRWLYNKDGSKNIDRWIKLEEAVNFFNLLKSHIKTGYLENPIPHKYARDGFYSVKDGSFVKGIGRYSQLIQPWQFGHGETKATCLWLINLPILMSSKIVTGRDQKIWRMPPSNDRKKLRSKTFPGIAQAMADQWGYIRK